MSNADVEVEVQDEDETMDNANDLIVGDHDDDDTVNQIKSQCSSSKRSWF